MPIAQLVAITARPNVASQPVRLQMVVDGGWFAADTRESRNDFDNG
jgi:hypothetical protein